jgi:hypothetical protein
VIALAGCATNIDKVISLNRWNRVPFIMSSPYC